MSHHQDTPCPEPASGSDLSHVYWMGGSPCCGKSTISDRIADRYGMRVYRCDDAYEVHTRLVTREEHPVFSRLVNATTDEVWLRPVPQQIDEEMALYREEFSVILEDLRALPQDQPIIAEGAALLPELLSRIGIDGCRMIWMVPTEEFQVSHYSRRSWRHDILRACSDPEQAWNNWMARDAGFAREVTLQAYRLGLNLITVDGSQSIEDTLMHVCDHWQLPSS